jgi:hypothetical protein
MVSDSGHYNALSNIIPGRPEPSETGPMVSWLPRLAHWEECAINKKVWTPEAEAAWGLIIDEIVLKGGQPRKAKFWKDWARGHSFMTETSPSVSWEKRRQVGYRHFRTRMGAHAERYWRMVFEEM